MSSLQIFKNPKIKAKTMQLCNAALLSTFFLKSFEYSNLVKHLRQAPELVHAGAARQRPRADRLRARRVELAVGALRRPPPEVCRA